MSAIKLSGLVSGMDTESIVKELMSAQRLKSKKIDNNITKLEWKQDKWKALNAKIYSFYTGALTKMKMEGSFETKKVTVSDESKIDVQANSMVSEGTQSVQVTSVASAQFITGSKLSTGITASTKLVDMGLPSSIGSSIDITVGKTSSKFEISATSTISDYTAALRKAGLNANFDAVQKRFFISSKNSGYENAFSLKGSTAEVDLTKLGLSEISKTDPDVNGIVDVTVGAGVSLIKPSDAAIIYNGAIIKSASNSITANGLTFTVKEKTKDNEVVSINVTNDTKAVYDSVKDFVKKYNELLKEMNEAYGAESAKGYEPLTDEEKKAMTEEQVTKWEDKIKNSLLRRDNTLNSIMDSMRTTLSKGVKVGDKSYSLSSFGIAATDYTEKGLLHIKGDKEDTLASMAEDELTKALTENPDAIKEVFNSLASELYDSFTENMKSTSLRSALTVYNDKEMKKTITTYKKDLSELEDRLQDMETRYYRQYTAMEKAMSKMNSESSYLTSILGTSSN